jgi:hypothetical protein
MVGYSYFDYDQMTLLGIEVHSDELELLQQVVDTYDWKSMEKEVEPKFRESALDFRDQKHSFVCARKDELDEDLQESFPFLDEMAETEVTGMNRNPKRAGRNGQEFMEQNSEAIAAVIAGNPAFYVACGFTHHPASRTLRYFDQIMCEYGLWDLVHDLSYRRNVEDEVVDESEEHILNIDNTHLRGYSTPGKYIKECRECELAEDCEDKVSTDASADWYIKGKYKCYYAHQIGVSQLADSGAPLGCVVLNGKQYEPDSLEPLLKDLIEKHPDLDIEKVNADGIFNSQPCRDKIREVLGEDVELFSSVNARRRKDIENPARGIAKITKHGNVQCIAGHNMVFLSKDYNMDSYILGCPVLNEEARKKLEHIGMEVPEQHECDKKAKCSPNSEIGRIYRAKRKMLSQIDWDNPQFSYHFKLVHSLRTKIERLFARMKERFKMRHVYKRGVGNIWGHVLKFMNLLHILANVTGSYGV